MRLVEWHASSDPGHPMTKRAIFILQNSYKPHGFEPSLFLIACGALVVERHSVSGVLLCCTGASKTLAVPIAHEIGQ